MDRKKFLQSSAAAAGLLLMPRPAKALAENLNRQARIPASEVQRRIVIIGSGYGGSVAALRLVEQGHEVTLLEMGLDWEQSGIPFSSMLRPGKSAAWLKSRSIAPFMNIFSLKKFTGALDRWDFDNIKIWMGRGLGGGSLVNGGMAVTPKQDYFREVFPTLDADLFYNTYFPRATKELGVNVAREDFLQTCSFYKFNAVGEAEAHQAGFNTVRVPNVYDFNYMEAEYCNEVPRSALAGEVIYGNNHGKLSLDKTYLRKALASGKLEILSLHKAEHIRQNADQTYTIAVSRINTLGTTIEEKLITAEKVFVTAGTMGTLKLLLKSKVEQGLLLNEEVGRHWGNNGNFMTGRNWVKPFAGGTGLHHSTIPVGGVDNWADPEHPFFTEIAPLPMGMNVATTLYLMINRVPKLGNLRYNPRTRKLALDWNSIHTAGMQEHARYFIKRMNRENGGTRAHFLFRNGYGPDICYHPLGGAVLGKATDHKGRLEGHRNLYVLDGSLVPGTIGVNPFMTITALAEFCMDQILAEDFS